MEDTQRVGEQQKSSLLQKLLSEWNGGCWQSRLCVVSRLGSSITCRYFHIKNNNFKFRRDIHCLFLFFKLYGTKKTTVFSFCAAEGQLNFFLKNCCCTATSARTLRGDWGQPCIVSFPFLIKNRIMNFFFLG